MSTFSATPPVDIMDYK